MAFTNSYSITNWSNDQPPPINETNLNNIEIGISTLYSFLNGTQSALNDITDISRSSGQLLSWNGNNVEWKTLSLNYLDPSNNLSDVANQQTALNNLTSPVSGNGKFLTSNGTNTVWASVSTASLNALSIFNNLSDVANQQTALNNLTNATSGTNGQILEVNSNSVDWIDKPTTTAINIQSSNTLDFTSHQNFSVTLGSSQTINAITISSKNDDLQVGYIEVIDSNNISGWSTKFVDLSGVQFTTTGLTGATKFGYLIDSTSVAKSDLVVIWIME
jgi:hypothetical protein